MAVKKTPDWIKKLTPQDVQNLYHMWREKHIDQYGDMPKDCMKGFNPNDYDIECARMDSHNSSYILTKWGYAINITMYTHFREAEPNKTYGKNDGVFYGRLGNGKIVMNGMTKETKGKNQWDYKELCNRYLKSSHKNIEDNMDSNFVNPWF